MNLTIDQIAADKQLAVQVQKLLINFKLLSGTADGKVGPQTVGALAQLLEITKSDRLTPELLQLKSLPQPQLDLSKGDFAAKIALYMLRENYWIDELHPNIIYVEGCDPTGATPVRTTGGTPASDWLPNNDILNEWNDLRLIMEISNNVPRITHIWKATTEPGRKYTNSPLNPNGAFRIAFGQYKAWAVGQHKDHEALVQVGEVTGYRDKNKDGFRTGDRLVKGSFGINQHHGYGMRYVDGASAGCLVGQSIEGHAQFMRIVKSDPRYQANSNYVFLTTILPGDKL